VEERFGVNSSHISLGEAIEKVMKRAVANRVVTS
jgi:hypothetical protein